jgi:hypothetical protein
MISCFGMTDALYELRKTKHRWEIAVMKQVIWCIFFLFAPAFAIAQDMSAKDNAAVNLNIQVASPQLLTDRNQSAAVELNALYEESKFGAEPDLNSEKIQTDHFELGIIEEWNERVFNKLKTYSPSGRLIILNGYGHHSTTDVDEQASERIMVTKVVLNETLSLTRERIPEIDSLVKTLKFEISSETTGTNSEAEAKGKGTVEASTLKNTVTEENVYYKTGLRLRIEGSLLGLVSETEVKYNGVSYYYKVNFDHQSDNSLGFTCVVGRGIHIQLERSFTGTMDPLTRGRSNRNMVQLVSKF